MPLPLDKAILQSAAHWYVELCASPDPQRRQAWQHWLQADPRHQQAWRRLEKLQGELGQLPASSRATLEHSRHSRRQALKSLCILLGVGGSGVLAYQTQPWQAWQADLNTATGQRKALQLADGRRLELNTGTHLDFDLGPQGQRLILRQGEIRITPTATPASVPLRVDTPQGSIEALAGACFNARLFDGHCQVSALEQSVMLQPRQAASQPIRLEAGRQAALSPDAVGASNALDNGLLLWPQGLLSVMRCPLGRFTDELARYQRGYLGCSPSVAQLQVSGTFRLDDIPGVLANLQANLPIRTLGLAPYWLRIHAA